MVNFITIALIVLAFCIELYVLAFWPDDTSMHDLAIVVMYILTIAFLIYDVY